jgi:protein-disulfide isomerase
MKKLFFSLLLVLGIGFYLNIPSTAHAAETTGSLDIVRTNDYYVIAEGWAAELGSGLSKTVSVLVFDGPAQTGTVIGHGITNVLRTDVNDYLRDLAGDRTHGFQIYLDQAPTAIAYAYAVNSLGTLTLIGTQKPVTDTPAEPPTTSEASVIPRVTEHDWVRGDLSKASVVMVEYSDIECPYCQRLYPDMLSISEEYGDDIAWVYRHFPLSSIHQEALPAARALECVGAQTGDGGFFTYLSALNYAQSEGAQLNDELYTLLVREMAGIDMSEFAACYSDHRYDRKIQAQMNGGAGAGVNGTPSTFVNGELVMGAVPREQMVEVIDRMLGL